jgi:hypothetical protein
MNVDDISNICSIFHKVQSKVSNEKIRLMIGLDEYDRVPGVQEVNGSCGSWRYQSNEENLDHWSAASYFRRHVNTFNSRKDKIAVRVLKVKTLYWCNRPGSRKAVCLLSVNPDHQSKEEFPASPGSFRFLGGSQVSLERTPSHLHINAIDD